MTRIDERLGVGSYLKQTILTVDGLCWLAICGASILCLLDILLGFYLIPLRDIAKPSKAVTQLLFSPLLVFLILVWLRQLPLSGYRAATWIRVALCIFAFLIINF